MEQKKLIKPKSCKECSAIQVDKNNFVCKCARNLKANKNNAFELQEMYKNCPIGWEN